MSVHTCGQVFTSMHLCDHVSAGMSRLCGSGSWPLCRSSRGSVHLWAPVSVSLCLCMFWCVWVSVHLWDGCEEASGGGTEHRSARCGQLSTPAPQLPTPHPHPPLYVNMAATTLSRLLYRANELPLLTRTPSCSQPWAHPAPPPAAGIAIHRHSMGSQATAREDGLPVSGVEPHRFTFRCPEGVGAVHAVWAAGLCGCETILVQWLRGRLNLEHRKGRRVPPHYRLLTGTYAHEP